MELVARADFDELKRVRAENPAAIAAALAARKRRGVLGESGRLLIIAADHPARGALAVAGDSNAMASRRDLLERFAEALANPAVDGVLGTADLIEDLALMGLLENRLVVGSMNRGGLSGSSFEFDDRFTGYSIAAIKAQGLDFAKTLLRINLEDAATAQTLETTARAVDDAVKQGVPIMIEPFMSRWIDGRAVNQLTPDDVIRSVAIASGLGGSSAMTWLKLPVVSEMHRVMEATSLPTLLLGGDAAIDRDDLLGKWESALELPGVRGLVVGRSLLYPSDGDVSAAIAAAARIVHRSKLGGN